MPKNQVDAKKFFWVPKISPGCQKTTFWHPRMPDGNADKNLFLCGSGFSGSKEAVSKLSAQAVVIDAA